jgi:hypothetical protein
MPGRLEARARRGIRSYNAPTVADLVRLPKRTDFSAFLQQSRLRSELAARAAALTPTDKTHINGDT